MCLYTTLGRLLKPKDSQIYKPRRINAFQLNAATVQVKLTCFSFIFEEYLSTSSRVRSSVSLIISVMILGSVSNEAASYRHVHFFNSQRKVPHSQIVQTLDQKVVYIRTMVSVTCPDGGQNRQYSEFKVL